MASFRHRGVHCDFEFVTIVCLKHYVKTLPCYEAGRRNNFVSVEELHAIHTSILRVSFLVFVFFFFPDITDF